MAEKLYPFGREKHAHDLMLVVNRLNNLADDALADSQYDKYEELSERASAAEEIYEAVINGSGDYKVVYLDGATVAKANELVAVAQSIRDGMALQYAQNDFEGVENAPKDSNKTAEYVEITSKITSDDATFDDAISYHQYIKGILYPQDKVKKNISAIESRLELSETDIDYVSSVWQSCILDKGAIVDRLSTAISENKRNSAYIKGVEQLQQKLETATKEGNTAECASLKSAILEGSKSFASHSVEGQEWNDITALTLFMKESTIKEMIKEPNAYESLLVACRDFIKNDGLEDFMCKRIGTYRAAECYPVDKASVFTVIKTENETTKEMGYAIAYLTTNGDIARMEKAPVERYAAQARFALDKKIKGLKAKGFDPVFVEYKDMVVLSFLAKMNSEKYSTFKDMAVGGKTKIDYNKDKINVDNLKNYEELKKGVKSFFESGKFKEYLDMCSRFHNYSFHNSLLIWLQEPSATRCASVKTWNALGRTVKAGAKGLHIYAPLLRKLSDEEKREQGIDVSETAKELRGFKLVSTFDLSQTEGKPLPSICEELTGSVEQMESIIRGLENVSGIKIEYKNIDGGAKGYYSPSEQRIVVQEGMDNLQTVKTAIHETAHSLFDNPQSKHYIPDSSRCDKEVRAESVAYMVSKQLGLDTSDYSFAYVTSWSSDKSVEELENNMKHIIKGTDEIFTAINKEIKLVDSAFDMLEMQAQAEQKSSQSLASGKGMSL